MRLSEAVELFLRARAAALAPSTQRWYAGAIQRLIAEVGDVALEGVTEEMLWAWLAALRSQPSRWRRCAYRPEAAGGLSPYTIDRQVQAVRSFFAWFVRRGHLASSPAATLEYRRAGERPPKRVTPEQLRALLAAARHPRDYALVRFVVATGARRAGVQGLRLGDLDLGDRSALVTEKGRKTRRVYFDAATAEALSRWLRVRPESDSDAVWVSEAGRPLSLDGVRQVLVRLCRKAGTGNISLHQLRHTMAYRALKRGVDPDLLREQLGHADLKTTYRLYVQWADEDRREAFGDDPLDDDPRLDRGRLRIVK